MDVLATVVSAIVVVLAAAAALFLSPFLLMATDSADQNADLRPLGWAYAVNWGGVAVGVVGAAPGVHRAVRHGGVMWIWPVLGIVVIGAGFAVAGLLAMRAARKRR